MQLAEFTSKIAHSLLKRNKPVIRPIGRPAKRLSYANFDEKDSPPKAPTPGNHVPLMSWDTGILQYDLKQWICRHCKMTLWWRVRCIKCSVQVLLLKEIIKYFFVLNQSKNALRISIERDLINFVVIYVIFILFWDLVFRIKSDV